MLIQNNTIHSYTTRQANNIQVSAFKRRLSQPTIRFTGAKLRNFMYFKLKTNNSLAWHGMAWHDMAWHGMA